MKFIVVSTYREGPKNIGDYLITKSTVDMLYNTFGKEIEVINVFRVEDLEVLKSKLDNVDHVVFACLAIRKNIDKYYNFAKFIMDSKLSYSVVAAGTALPVYSGKTEDFTNQITEEDKVFLRSFSARSHSFSVRDILSFSFLKSINVDEIIYTGDIAFTSGLEKIEFSKKSQSRPLRIAISDPHYADMYSLSLSTLIKGLRRIFPKCEIQMLVHGINDEAKRIANDNFIECIEIWRDKESGLNEYSSYDLHVGYRVHGHVSALSRGVFSYLLEQDGRGCGYGLSLEKKITVSNFRPGVKGKGRQAAPAEVLTLLAIIESDYNNNFKRFEGIEKEIENIRSNNRTLFETLDIQKELLKSEKN